jgi:hypothetical protein
VTAPAVPATVCISGSSRATLLIPPSPRRAAHAALAVYHPLAIRAQVVWHITRAFARLGGFRLLPESHFPDAVSTALSNSLRPGDSVAVARGSRPGRYIALVVDGAGRSRMWAKVAETDVGMASLNTERDALAHYGQRLGAPLRPPKIVKMTDHALFLEPVEWRPRIRPWQLTEDVVRALALLNRAGISHGDFAPWNLLKSASGWVVVDWESAAPAGTPFFDLFHYLVQSHVLLGRPRRREIVAAIDGEGRLGRLVRLYATAHDVSLARAPTAFGSYLRAVQEKESASRAQEPAIASRRRALEVATFG